MCRRQPHPRNRRRSGGDSSSAAPTPADGLAPEAARASRPQRRILHRRICFELGLLRPQILSTIRTLPPRPTARLQLHRSEIPRPLSKPPLLSSEQLHGYMLNRFQLAEDNLGRAPLDATYRVSRASRRIPCGQPFHSVCQREAALSLTRRSDSSQLRRSKSKSEKPKSKIPLTFRRPVRPHRAPPDLLRRDARALQRDLTTRALISTASPRSTPPPSPDAARLRLHFRGPPAVENFERALLQPIGTKPLLPSLPAPAPTATTDALYLAFISLCSQPGDKSAPPAHLLIAPRKDHQAGGQRCPSPSAVPRLHYRSRDIARKITHARAPRLGPVQRYAQPADMERSWPSLKSNPSGSS